MAKGRSGRPSRKIKPTFYIFCEGETEEAYVNMLKRNYRVSTVKIKTNVSGSKISKKYIDNYLKDKTVDPSDTTFLLYDGDLLDILSTLESIPKTTLLITNPVVEFWFLLHFKEIHSFISVEQCLKELKKFWVDYKKGSLTDKQKRSLSDNQSKAIERVQGKSDYRKNPSSTLYKLIEQFESVGK